MSLSEILSSALSGLGASQSGMRTVSNNIANVGTTGYARQRVNQQPEVTAGRTGGVAVGEPTRVADRYLEETVYERAGDAGRAETVSGYLDRLQSLLGVNGAESALPARIDAIQSAATAMTGAAGTTQSAALFVGNVADAIGSLQQLKGDVEHLHADTDGELGSTVTRINALLRQVHDLNDTVSRLSVTGRTTAGAADQRTTALQELSSLIGIEAREQPNGKVTVETASGVPLIDQRLRQLSYAGGAAGASQPVYSPIELRFADGEGMGAATGETIASAPIGGKLGGLIDLRDNQLPQFLDKLGSLGAGLTQTLNAASNAATAVPPPARLDGRATMLTGGDRLGFTGAATFAVTRSDGTLVASTRIDFSALPAGATLDDAVTAINAGLGGAGTATFIDGKLSIAATASGDGVVVAQDNAAPSDRAGMGFSQFFGLNDLIRSDHGSLAPSGFIASDPHGFAGGSVDFALRDASGRLMAKATLTPAAGGNFGSLVTALNGGTLGSYGSFSLDPASGRLRFEPVAGNTGATLSIPADSTDRAGTGQSFTRIMGLTGDTAGLSSAAIRPDIAANAARLPLARLQDVPVGSKALGTTDKRGASAFVDALSQQIDLGKEGSATISRYAAALLGSAGAASARANTQTEQMTARRDDAINRRDNYSGVNLDEELSQMVVLQNSYSAAARVMSTAGQMYDALLGMVR